MNIIAPFNQTALPKLKSDSRTVTPLRRQNSYDTVYPIPIHCPHSRCSFWKKKKIINNVLIYCSLDLFSRSWVCWFCWIGEKILPYSLFLHFFPYSIGRRGDAAASLDSRASCSSCIRIDECVDLCAVLLFTCSVPLYEYC